MRTPEPYERSSRDAAGASRRGFLRQSLLFPLSCVLAPLAGCKSKAQSGQTLGASIRQGPEPDVSRDELRLLFAQIVEDSVPTIFQESAILEGKPYRYFLRSLAGVKHDDLRKRTNEDVTFPKLVTNPGMYRGQVVTLARGVVLEVSRAELTPEYGLPPGYTVLPGVFVDAARDVYALRILCSPGSKLYGKLDQGIQEDALPVVRLSGYFMKLYARRTADPNEPPWRKPLLICPEPEFSQAAEPRKVWQELNETNTARFLPSQRIEAPGADERLVIEVLAQQDQPLVRIEGKDVRDDVKGVVSGAIEGLRKRLPAGQADCPSAVILVGPSVRLTWADPIVAALRAVGVKRIALKTEL